MTSIRRSGGDAGAHQSPSTPSVPVLVPVANACANGSCPTVYRTDRGTVVVQGYTVPVNFDVPTGELVVEIPTDLLMEASRNLS